jgi:hypothetical protein
MVRGQGDLEGDRSPLDEGPHEGIFCLANG